MFCKEWFFSVIRWLKLLINKSFICLPHRPLGSLPGKDQLGEERKKPRPKDVFGRPLPTEEEFEVLKNAPRYVK